MDRRLALVVAAAVIAAAAPAAAQHSGVDAQLYRPAIDPYGTFSLEGGATLDARAFALDAGIALGQEPLRVAVPGIGATADDDAADSVLDNAVAMHITAAFGLSPRLTLAIDAGMVRTDPDVGYGTRGRYRADGTEASTGLLSLRPQSNVDPVNDLDPAGRVVPLDARVGLKLRVLDRRRLQLAVLGLASLPFGDEEMFLGDRGFVFEPRLAASLALGGTQLFANAGARLRERTVLEAYDPMREVPDDARVVLDVGSEAFGGIGASHRIGETVSLAAEAVAFVPLPSGASFGDCRRYNGDRCASLAASDYFGGARAGDLAAYALVGARVSINADVTFQVHGGSAALAGDGRGELLRVMTGVAWHPVADPALRARGDADGDALPDGIDMCPDEPEDHDDYQDSDGCPDLDNDGDGVLDVDDGCLDAPEDRDGRGDRDGCPDLDDDGDGASDVLDGCPTDPEDDDGYEDDDGCPEEDNDGDGVADASDQCVNDAETVNGYDDLDGCPDESLGGGPHLAADGIDLSGERLRFARDGSPTRESRAVLDGVAALLQQNPDVRVRIEVSVARSTTASGGGALARALRRDADVTARRARAIAEYLVGRGVAAGRVQYVGHGSKFPRDPARPHDADNERVEFVRIEQDVRRLP